MPCLQHDPGAASEIQFSMGAEVYSVKRLLDARLSQQTVYFRPLSKIDLQLSSVVDCDARSEYWACPAPGRIGPAATNCSIDRTVLVQHGLEGLRSFGSWSSQKT